MEHKAMHILLWQALSQEKTIFARNIYGENEGQTSDVMTYWVISHHLQGIQAASEREFPISRCALFHNANRGSHIQCLSIVASWNSDCVFTFLSIGGVGILFLSIINACLVLLCALTCLTTTQYRWQQRSDTLAELLKYWRMIFYHLFNVWVSHRHL